MIFDQKRLRFATSLRVLLMLLMSFSSFACSLPTHGADESELPKPAVDLPLSAEEHPQPRDAVFAGGCFWCTEAVFRQLKGVSNVVPGYAGGKKSEADYRTVCGGKTDHAEAIRITYDPSKITYGELLRIFFTMHDPTQLNRQGPDTGRQYRSAVFYANEDEKKVAEAYIKQLVEAKSFDAPIVTTLEPLKGSDAEEGGFYVAEQYHHDYVKLHPNEAYIRATALPKVKKVREKFADQVKTDEKQPSPPPTEK